MQAYRSFLADRQAAVLGRLGSAAPKPTYSYRMAFAGFAADLTSDQARTLRRAPGVARVWRDAVRQAAGGHDARRRARRQDRRRRVLPRAARPACGSELGGVNHAGEGVIVGVLDTGIVPEHPSFADRPGAGYRGPRFTPPDVLGRRLPGRRAVLHQRLQQQADRRALLRRRLRPRPRRPDRLPVAARRRRARQPHRLDRRRQLRRRPGINGNDLGVDVVSGIAPRAYVAMYKVCWESDVAPAGCANSDIVAAIDQAVADGVDVINYSIGSDSSALIGPTEVAFLGASDAGVFVANSAGNAGPGESTVGSPASVPWLTTVAAASLARTFEATATIHAGGYDARGQGRIGHQRAAVEPARRRSDVRAAGRVRGGRGAVQARHARPDEGRRRRRALQARRQRADRQEPQRPASPAAWG